MHLKPETPALLAWSPSRIVVKRGTDGVNDLDVAELGDQDGTVVAAWRLPFWTVVGLLFRRRRVVYVSVMTRGRSLLPLRVDAGGEPDFVADFRRYWDEVDEATT